MLIVLATLSAWAGAVTVDAALPGGEGVVVLHLYDSSRGWPASPRPSTLVATGTMESGAATVTLGDVPAGTWAAVVFLDRNGNGQLDTNWFGLPTEPVGVSYPEGEQPLGPPFHGRSSFEVAAEPVRLAITMWAP